METSEFLDRKLSRRFRTYDDDGDGFVEREDFAVASRRFGAEFGHGPESEAWQRFDGLCVGLWEHLVRVADANGDGRISEQEYKDAFARGMLETEASFDAAYVPFLAALLRIVDTDGDGRIDVDEEIRWTGSLMRLSEVDARTAFDHLDEDGDGYIGTEQLLEAIRAFYFDKDPAGPGSWLLGDLDH
jgi:Ca2+-binding EF-hand superfamily protein